MLPSVEGHSQPMGTSQGRSRGNEYPNLTLLPPFSILPGIHISQIQKSEGKEDIDMVHALSQSQGGFLFLGGFSGRTHKGHLAQSLPYVDHKHIAKGTCCFSESMSSEEFENPGAILPPDRKSLSEIEIKQR